VAVQQKQATVTVQSDKTSQGNSWSQMMKEEIGETSISTNTHPEEETHSKSQQTSEQQM
ncbi:1146_t:CDS:1, partial [Acaulospora morrowiae]